jgi:hypothetical protein
MYELPKEILTEVINSRDVLKQAGVKEPGSCIDPQLTSGQFTNGFKPGIP